MINEEFEKCNQDYSFHNGQAISESDYMSFVQCENEVIMKKSKKATTNCRWQKEESDRLLEAVEKYGTKSWRVISYKVGNKSALQCRQRYEKVIKPGIVKGKWSPTEDQRLLCAVQPYLSRNTKESWKKIATHVPGRTSKQCRERWLHHLAPHVSKTDFTEEEDQKLVKLCMAYNNSWAKIAHDLPGRTENMVRSRITKLKNSGKYPHLSTSSVEIHVDPNPSESSFDDNIAKVNQKNHQLITTGSLDDIFKDNSKRIDQADEITPRFGEDPDKIFFIAAQEHIAQGKVFNDNSFRSLNDWSDKINSSNMETLSKPYDMSQQFDNCDDSGDIFCELLGLFDDHESSMEIFQTGHLN